MKIRNGFVSNSSSSSFVIRLDKNKDKETQINDLLDRVIDVFDIEDETEYQGVDNAVVDCEKNLVISHSEDEKPDDCLMKKEPLEKPVAGEKVEIKINEAVSKSEQALKDGIYIP